MSAIFGNAQNVHFNEIFKERYGKIDIGDRGGIIVPGSKLNAPLNPV